MLLYYFVNNQFKAFSINLNVQHVNGMAPFDGKLGQASIFLGQDLKKSWVRSTEWYLKALSLSLIA